MTTRSYPSPFHNRFSGHSSLIFPSLRQNSNELRLLGSITNIEFIKHHV